MKLLPLLLILLAVPVFGADIDFTWDAVPGATGYKLYKSEDGGATWGTPVDVGNVTAYKWLGVVENKLVLFRASSYNATDTATRSWSGAWYDHRLRLGSPGIGIP